MKKEHDYLSTACFHGIHNRCRQRCKFCNILCGCECHDDTRDQDSAEIDELETLAK